MYTLGTLKVAWVESNVEYLSSDMFKPNELDKAVAYGEKVGDYMIMQLVAQEKDLYRWRVLPYGNYKQYLSSMRLRRKFEKLFSNESGYNESAYNESAYNDVVKLYDTQLSITKILAVILTLIILVYVYKNFMK